MLPRCSLLQHPSQKLNRSLSLFSTVMLVSLCLLPTGNLLEFALHAPTTNFHFTRDVTVVPLHVWGAGWPCRLSAAATLQRPHLSLSISDNSTVGPLPYLLARMAKPCKHWVSVRRFKEGGTAPALKNLDLMLADTAAICLQPCCRLLGLALDWPKNRYSTPGALKATLQTTPAPTTSCCTTGVEFNDVHRASAGRLSATPRGCT